MIETGYCSDYNRNSELFRIHQSEDAPSVGRSSITEKVAEQKPLFESE
jgi:hypothetical protein